MDLDTSRSARQFRIQMNLAGNGFDAYNFAGGFRYYDAVANDRRLIEQATACGMDK